MKLYFVGLSIFPLFFYALSVLWLMRKIWRGTWGFFGPFCIIFIYLVMLKTTGHLIADRMPAGTTNDARALYFFMALAPPLLCLLGHHWKGAISKLRRAGAVFAVAGAAYFIVLGDVTWYSWKLVRACPEAGMRIYRIVEADGFIPSSEYAVLHQGYRFGESRVDPKNGLVTRWEKTESGNVVRVGPVPPKSEWELVDFDPDYTLGVTMRRSAVQNRLTKEIIAEKRSFRAWNGWIDAVISGLMESRGVGSCYGNTRRLLYSHVEQILIPPEK